MEKPRIEGKNIKKQVDNNQLIGFCNKWGDVDWHECGWHHDGHLS